MAQNIFVAMPFKHSFDPVLDLIKDAGNLLNAQTTRVDESHVTGSIISHIRSQIDQSDRMVAVVSEDNGNVYYEIGLAHCQKKPVVLLTSDSSTMKFDLRDHRAIIYDPKRPRAVRDELVSTIKAAMDVTSDPSDFIASAFQATEGHFGRASGIDKAKNTIIQEANLHRPANVTFKSVDAKSKQLSLEVTDFLGVRVRAVFDINGILVTSKQM